MTRAHRLLTGPIISSRYRIVNELSVSATRDKTLLAILVTLQHGRRETENYNMQLRILIYIISYCLHADVTNVVIVGAHQVEVEVKS